MLLFLATAVIDALVVGALAWLVRGTERRQVRVLAEQQAVLERLRAELEDLVADAERRARTLDHALAMREATLRVLVQASAQPRETTAAPCDDPAEVRLLRDLDLTVERPPQAGPDPAGR